MKNLVICRFSEDSCRRPQLPIFSVIHNLIVLHALWHINIVLVANYGFLRFTTVSAIISNFVINIFDGHQHIKESTVSVIWQGLQWSSSDNRLAFKNYKQNDEQDGNRCIGWDFLTVSCEKLYKTYKVSHLSTTI